MKLFLGHWTILLPIYFVWRAKLVIPQNLEVDVLELSDHSVNGTLQQPDRGVLLKLLPEYAAAATDLKQENLSVVLAKIDATLNPITTGWLDVKGYPTLTWFFNGQRETYNGARSRNAITYWIKKRLIGTESLDTLEDFERVKRLSEVFLLGYFERLEGEESDIFQDAAKAIEAWPVYATSSLEVAQAVNLSSSPGFIVGTNFDYNRGEFRGVSADGHSAFRQGRSLKDSLLHFVRTEQLPPYLPYSSATSERVFAMPRQLFAIGPLMDLQPDGEALQLISKIHTQFKGEFAFATAAIGTDPADMLRDFFGLAPINEIQIVAFVPEEEKYKLLEALTEESLLRFCQGVFDGSYQRYYKSAPLPSKAKDGFVTLVVGRSFNEIVLDPKRDVMLMVYAKWSDKSKHLGVIWKKLAQHMRNVDSFVAAKLEAGANEHADLTGTAVPYILFYPAGKSEGMKFAGEPSLKELLKYIRKHATVPIDFSAKPPLTAQSKHEEL